MLEVSVLRLQLQKSVLGEPTAHLGTRNILEALGSSGDGPRSSRCSVRSASFGEIT